MSPPTRHRLRQLTPAAAWSIGAGVLWFWHAARPYQAALADDRLHGIQHLSFLGAGLFVWSIVAGAGRPRRASPGVALFLLFALGLQTTVLAALMTFSTRPWYSAYADTTSQWGLDQITDQHFAGALMWFPTGFVHLAAAMWLLVQWLGAGPMDPSAEAWVFDPRDRRVGPDMDPSTCLGLELYSGETNLGEVEELIRHGDRSYFVVDTRHWTFGTKRLVPTDAIESAERNDGILQGEVDVDQVRCGPDFDPFKLHDCDYWAKVRDHYQLS